MTIHIRAASQKDLPQLDELMFLLHSHHHEQCPHLFKTAEEIEQEKSIARYLDSPECLVYVAKDESDRVVGFVTGHFCELISSVSKAIPMGSIDELFVLPESRKAGIAGKLLAKIEQTLTEYGVQQIFVEVWDFNQAAQALYNKVGFSAHIHWLRKSVV
ncbi:MAG TPA: N-acetyltransferase [Vibrio sp.]|uniref:GNAT family N-acetyltransferase n=1 Tax=Vibrio TaxID=662 RepID=UPI000ED94012|nr:MULTISPECIES: GNAT family N-acetyltransferase [Vibrio]HCH02143.1 N-acetyltransferase [Vibrio sp.]